MSLPRISLHDYRTKATIVALVVVLVGVLALAGVTQIHHHEATVIVIREIAAVLIAIGSLEIIHQWFLHRDLTTDLIGVVGLKTSVVEVGLDDLKQDTPDWRTFLSRGSAFAVLPIDPLMWMRTEWTHVIWAAKRRKISLTLYLPHPPSDAFNVMAARLGTDIASFTRELQSTAQGVFDAWQHEPLLKSGAQLTIVPYLGLPGYEIALADDYCLVSLHGSGSTPLGLGKVTLTFARGRESGIGEWCVTQFDALITEPPRTYRVP